MVTRVHRPCLMGKGGREGGREGGSFCAVTCIWCGATVLTFSTCTMHAQTVKWHKKSCEDLEEGEEEEEDDFGMSEHHRRELRKQY